MPTSPRDLAGGTGWYQPTARLSNPRADVGIGPYASGKIVPCNQVRTNISGLPSTPGESGATLSKQERAGVSLIRQGLRPATFPGGEGCLRRGITVYLLCPLLAVSPRDSSTGCYSAVERGCEEGPIHKNTPQLFYKLWRNFLGFPGGSGGRAGERDG